MLKLPCGDCTELHEVPCIECKGELELIEQTNEGIYYVKCLKCGYQGSFGDNPYAKPDPNYFDRRNNRDGKQ